MGALASSKKFLGREIVKRILEDSFQPMYRLRAAGQHPVGKHIALRCWKHVDHPAEYRILPRRVDQQIEIRCASCKLEALLCEFSRKFAQLFDKIELLSSVPMEKIKKTFQVGCWPNWSSLFIEFRLSNVDSEIINAQITADLQHKIIRNIQDDFKKSDEEM